MPSYLAEIEVMLKPLVNDPQGLAVLDGLKNLGFSGAERVRVGKRIRSRQKIVDIQEKNPGQWLMKTSVSVEIEGETTPALIAELLTLLIVSDSN